MFFRSILRPIRRPSRPFGMTGEFDKMTQHAHSGIVQRATQAPQRRCQRDHLETQVHLALSPLNTRLACARTWALNLRIVSTSANRWCGDFPSLVEPRPALAGSALGAATNTARDTVFPILDVASVVVRCVPRPNTSQSSSPFGDTSVADPSGLSGLEGVGGVRGARVPSPSLPALSVPCLSGSLTWRGFP